MFEGLVSWRGAGIEWGGQGAGLTGSKAFWKPMECLELVENLKCSKKKSRRPLVTISQP